MQCKALHHKIEAAKSHRTLYPKQLNRKQLFMKNQISQTKKLELLSLNPPGLSFLNPVPKT